MTVGFLLALVLAQGAPADIPPQPDLQRIRRALEKSQPSLLSPTTDRDGPIFRMKIEAFELAPAWTDRSVVPPYVRTWLRGYHHEHMEMVTPEEFRGATLYPSGLPVDRLVGYMVKEIKAARRASQEKRARDVVAREFAAFLACRTDSSTAGCARR